MPSRPSQTVRSFIALAIILFIGAGLLLMSGFLNRSNDDLLKHATRLTNEKCFKYVWISDGTLWFWGSGDIPEHLDLKTGLKTPIPRFPNIKGLRGFEFGNFSPDGQWFVTRDTPKKQFLAYSLTGMIKTWKFPPNSTSSYQSLWFPDSRRWIERYYDSTYHNRFVIHAIDHAKDSAPFQTFALDSASTVLSNDKILGIDFINDTMSVYRTDLATGNVKESLFKMPWKYYQDIRCIISQNGNYIAWFKIEGHAMALIDWININLPAFRRPDNATLWVSKIDGTDKKALGVIQNANSQDTSTLKWTPDGKSLSFLFKSQLYQVSTE